MQSTSGFALWSRSSEGVLAGVCSGFAKRFKLDVVLVRIVLVFSFLIYGAGICLYLLLALGLPREDKIDKAYESRILGVCSRFAKRFDLDIGLVRVGFLILLFGSFGMMFFAYILLNFILPKDSLQIDSNKQN